MKLNLLKLNWLIPVLGIALAGSLFAGATAYLRLDREIRSAEGLAALLDRLYCDQQVSMALKQLHNGEVTDAAHRLDVMLCGEIIKIDSQLAYVDAPTRAYAQASFGRIGHSRPKLPEALSDGATVVQTGDQMTAQRILALAVDHERAAR